MSESVRWISQTSFGFPIKRQAAFCYTSCSKPNAHMRARRLIPRVFPSEEGDTFRVYIHKFVNLPVLTAPVPVNWKRCGTAVLSYTKSEYANLYINLFSKNFVHTCHFICLQPWHYHAYIYSSAWWFRRERNTFLKNSSSTHTHTHTHPATNVSVDCLKILDTIKLCSAPTSLSLFKF